MAFTDKDREVLTATKTKVDNIEKWVENMPCQQHPPECTQEQRLDALETSRARGITAVITIVIGLVVAGGTWLMAKIGG